MAEGSSEPLLQPKNEPGEPVTDSGPSDDGPRGLKRTIDAVESDGYEDNSDTESDNDDIDTTMLGDSADTYDPKSEDRPNAAVFHPSFLEAKQASADIVKSFADVVSQSRCEGPHFEALEKQLDRNGNLREPPAVRVAVVGDAGMGKSSLIISLLHEDSIAAKGDACESRTLVVQEFSKAPETQKSRLAAEVVLFDKTACHNLIRGMLKDFNAHWRTYESADDDEDNPKDETDQISTANVQTAKEITTALFSNRPGFESQTAAYGSMKAAEIKHDSKLLSDMLKWVDDILEHPVCASGSIVTSADTTSELLKKLKPFMERPPRTRRKLAARSAARDDQSEEDDDHDARNEADDNAMQPESGTQQEEGAPAATQEITQKTLRVHLWPFVKVVRTSVKSDSAVLNQGVTVVDLPGLSDINRLRVKHARQMLTGCNFTVVVGKIARVATDPSVLANLRLLSNRRDPGRMIMVCTHTDTADTNGNDNKFKYSAAQKAISKKIIQEKQALVVDYKRMMLEHNSAKGSKKTGIKNKMTAILNKIKALSARLEECQILTKNDEATRALRNTCKTWLKGGDGLQVFCVSNKIYQTYLKGYDKNEPPKLSVENTNIPSLRAWLLSLPAKQQLQTFRNHVESHLPTLFNSIDMFCSKDKIQHKDRLAKVIASHEQPLAEQINSSIVEYKDKQLFQILQTCKMRQASWVKLAAQKCDKWKSLHWGTYRGYILRGGKPTKQGVKEGLASWNTQLLAPAEKDFGNIWDEHELEFKDWARNLVTTVTRDMDKLMGEVSSDPAASIGILNLFLESIENRKNTLRLNLLQIGEIRRIPYMRIEEKSIRDIEEGYLTEAMEQIYDELSEIQGKGSTLLRPPKLKAFVTNPKNVFAAIYRGVQEDSNSELQELQDEFVEEFKKVISEIQTDLSLIGDAPSGDADWDAMREKLLSLLEEKRGELHGHVRTLLNAADPRD